MNSAIPAFVHSYELWLLWSFRSDDGIAMDLCDAFGAHCSNNSLLSCIQPELAGLSMGSRFVKKVEVGGVHINSVKMMMRE